MALDQHRIAIRERGYLEIMDLALRVVRAYAGPLAVAVAAGVGPVMIFNWWLLAGYANRDFELGFPILHMIYMTLLIYLEVPLATAPLVLYLGRATFADRPRPRDLVWSYFAALPQLLFYQVLLRPFYVFRAYLTEVIVLEQTPMRSGKSKQPSTSRRSKALHRGEAPELLARSLLATPLRLVLIAAIWSSIYVVGALLTSHWALDRSMYTVYYPLTVWLVACFFAVVRFLFYLDLRIRREGWEVELLLRAEQARLTRSLS